MSEKLGKKPVLPAMSQRLLIAKDAMCALISNKTAFDVALKSGFKDESVIVTAAYQYADELLRQEHLNK